MKAHLTPDPSKHRNVNNWQSRLLTAGDLCRVVT